MNIKDHKTDYVYLWSQAIDRYEHLETATPDELEDLTARIDQYTAITNHIIRHHRTPEAARLVLDIRATQSEFRVIRRNLATPELPFMKV